VAGSKKKSFLKIKKTVIMAGYKNILFTAIINEKIMPSDYT